LVVLLFIFVSISQVIGLEGWMFASVKRLTGKMVSEMICNLSVGALNPVYSTQLTAQWRCHQLVTQTVVLYVPVSHITYTVLAGTLNRAQSINQLLTTETTM